jgi:hypothetical protein
VAIGRAGDLDIDQDMTFQRRSWIVQRVGWSVIGAAIAAALLGLLGSGPLSRSTAVAPGAFAVGYERFVRYEDPETLAIRLEPEAAADRLVRLAIDRRYLDRSRLQSALPSPERVESADGRVIFVFRTAEPGRPLPIVLTLKPQRFGPIEGWVRLESGPASGREVRFRQFAYP